MVYYSSFLAGGRMKGRPKIFSKENRILLLSLLIYIVLSNVYPWGLYALYPFELLTTWFHEMSHGMMTILVGGQFDHLKLYPDTSGIAWILVPQTTVRKTLAASAGYLGSALAGSLLIILGRWEKTARFIITCLALALGLSALFFVRNLFGLIAVLAWTAFLGLFCLSFSRHANVFLLNLLAGMIALNALADIRALYASNLMVNGKPHGMSDAHAVAEMLLLPSWFWASLWLALSVILFLWAIWSYRLKPAVDKINPR